MLIHATRKLLFSMYTIYIHMNVAQNMLKTEPNMNRLYYREKLKIISTLTRVRNSIISLKLQLYTLNMYLGY